MAWSILYLLVAMVSIQGGASIAKGLFPLIGAQGTTTLRLLIAAIILAAISKPWRIPTGTDGRLSLKLRPVLWYGLALGSMNYLFYLALERIPLGIAVTLEFTGPLSVALLASRRPVDFLWAALAAGGIYLVLPMARESSAGLDPLGILLALGAGVSWAFYIIFGKRAGASGHSGLVTALGMIVAAVLVFPFGVIEAGTKLLGATVLPAALAVAVLSSALPYSLEMVALKNIPARNFGILMSLEPAVAALSGLAFLQEQLTFSQWLAIGFIILASLGSTLTSAEEPLPPEPTAGVSP